MNYDMKQKLRRVWLSPPNVSPVRLHILELIDEGRRRGRPFSYREIAKRIGVHSTNGVQQHINALHEMGLVTLSPHEARTIMPKFRFIPADELLSPVDELPIISQEESPRQGIPS